MKKSEVVLLSVLTGGVVLAMTHQGTSYRDHYASREDCEADWRSGPCEASSSGSGIHGGYYGPRYTEGSRPPTMNRDLVTNREVVKRSGFGHSGARFSGGG